ncbi:kelch-like protein 22 [Erpetoichthys calabaricus]|uniref:Kelch like family member 22 n=1 Tax=Erpetoichthys calabaricus TaxID=27687 RepID=A0A8C4TCY1_ERPCA|nr:kelch-like protein 22 [Erpetoichthys calabaricus]XP_028680771.1 kelch-like protein 22 [Erpetoichthys calabaricus]XP_028680772.1 kelch-like protein 22 [Erpetoichthys calabaricus]
MAEDGKLEVRSKTTNFGQGKSEESGRHKYRSSSHSQNLLQGLVALRSSGVLFDVVLFVEGKPIKAHRILLAASCDYFRGMFAGGLREMQENEVQVHGVSYKAMCTIVDFIYTSELELSVDNVQDILSAACLLQMQDVISFCCDFLIFWVDEENILEVYRLAEMFGLSQLCEKVDAYIFKNLLTFSRTPVYRQLPFDKVYTLLSSNKLEVSSENEVYEACLHYYYTPEQVENNQVSLKNSLKLLETVRFTLMEKHILKRLYSKLDNCPLRKMLWSALHYHEMEELQPVLQSPQTQLRSEFKCIVGFGGMYSSRMDTISNEAKFLNPVTNEWTSLTTTRAPRMSNQGIAVLNNFVYLIGGDNNTSGFRAESRCWRYDPRHNSWFQIQSLQQQHADHCICAAGDYLYAIAGRDYRKELKVVERYSPQTNTWEYVAPLENEVYAHAGAVAGGKIYITCGRRGSHYLKETICYDPQTDTWESKADSLICRAWHGMAELGGKLYVIGGSNDNYGTRKDVLVVACYNPATDEWTSVSPLPAGHGEAGIAVLDNQIYVLGGRSHDRCNLMDYVHIYDATKDIWFNGTCLEDDLSGLAACVVILPRSVVMDTENRTTEHLAFRLPVNQGLDDLLSADDWDESDNSSED